MQRRRTQILGMNDETPVKPANGIAAAWKLFALILWD